MDQSISRSHAKLTVSGPPITGGTTPTAALPTVTLNDLSKFGTRVNGCKLERNGSGLAVVELKSGQELKFGGTPTSAVFRYTFAPDHGGSFMFLRHEPLHLVKDVVECGWYFKCSDFSMFVPSTMPIPILPDVVSP